MIKTHDKADGNAELKSRLDALPATEGLWSLLANPVPATSELARLLLRGEVEDLHLYAGGQHGISMPTAELGSIIYVPEPILKLDEESKARDKDNGISLTSFSDKDFFAYRNYPDYDKMIGFLDRVLARL